MTQRTIHAQTEPSARENAQLTLTEYAVLGVLGHLQRPISGYDLL